VLVGLHVLAAAFFADRADAEPDLLLIGIHLDDLEVELLSWIALRRRAMLVGGLGVVAQALYSICNFDECAEARDAQNLAVNHVANAVLGEERLPNIGLQLLHAER